MKSYKYLINKIYPARVNEDSDMTLYYTMEKAYFKLKMTEDKNGTVLYEYWCEFYFLKQHICKAITDGMQMIAMEADEFDCNQLENIIYKLNSNLYDINELEELLSFANLIFSGYSLNKVQRQHFYPHLSISA